MEGKEASMNFDLEKNDITSPLFPYPFIFRNQQQLKEYIWHYLTKNKVLHVTKLVLGVLTLVLPLLNVFMVYRSLIHQQEDSADVYSVFHSIIFYGEFVLVHVLVFGTLIAFLYRKFKNTQSICSNKGEWINLLDMEITFMAFNMIKLIPIISLNSFNLLMKQISICAPIFLRYSRSSQIVTFSLLTLFILMELVVVIILLLSISLVKVYQVSFVGEKLNPLVWTHNQWLLFIGFAANIINITDTPTVSQLSFMWDITNKTWSDDVNMWFIDEFARKRKTYILDEICEKLGFVKGFLWVRTMSAIDLHCIVRLPPPLPYIEQSFSHM
ncbi:hypothetical protein I4U23_023011 [Adineta vaga]|nr:hypothetical protein I4U23_023011 [Adineta vaga]